MSKKALLYLILLVIIVIGIIYIYEKQKNTTFEKVFKEMISQEDSIEEIKIVHYKSIDESQSVLMNEEELNRILYKSSDMKLKKVRTKQRDLMLDFSISLDYSLTNNRYMILLFDEYIYIDGNQYKVISENNLLHQLEWE